MSPERNEEAVEKSFVLCSAMGPVPVKSSVLLGTALIEIRCKSGKFRQFRALLDSGSEISIISQKCFSTLGVSSHFSSTEIRGVGNHRISNTGKTEIFFRPASRSKSVFVVDTLILPRVCDKIPSSTIATDGWDYLTELCLADPSYYKPGDIDVLLGADVFSTILGGHKVSGKNGGPDALETALGYVLVGKVSSGQSMKIPSQCYVNSFMTKAATLDLSNMLQNFFDVESVPTSSHCSPSDIQCEEIFQQEYSRTESGRYVVPLPFKEYPVEFPLSKELALQRYLSLEKRFQRNPRYYQEYSQVIREYLQLGHMEVVDLPTNNFNFYLPHHAVLRPEKSTTPMRVVFNGSSPVPIRGNATKSLNQLLHVGPKLQTDIFSVLSKFRLHRIGFTADIKQMYRQILVAPQYLDYQRLLFRFAINEDIVDLRIKTVCFGINCAPYLALRTMHQLAVDGKDRYSLASKVLLSDMYVDDICSGSNSLEEALKIKDELIDALKNGGFELRKWTSNDSDFLKSIPQDQVSFSPTVFEEDSQEPALKILGLLWDPVQDSFFFKINPLDRSCTKRHLLSELARIFDPLGFLAPLTFFCKYLIQRLWLQGIDWDERPSEDILKVWHRYKSELSSLGVLKVPRWIHASEGEAVEIHGFCDASEKGYGAVVYLKVLNHEPRLHFLCSKSKVAPCRQKLSIPRMELCGAVLVTKLILEVIAICKQQLIIDKTNIYTDSQIVLAWLRSPSSRWHTFVANRVSFIQENVSFASWHYVKGHLNPADAASRGLFPSELLDNDLWFNGPPISSLNASHDLDDFDTVEEERKTSLTVSGGESILETLLLRNSSFSRLLRILVFIRRFISNCRSSSRKQFSFISSSELTEALKVLVKYTQSVHFASEIETKNFSKPLRKLNAFYDDCGILRVGGRLTWSKLGYDKKHPILLPKKSRLTELLIVYYHEKWLHAGVRTTQFLLSQTFWILAARQAVRRILSKCLACWKTNPIACNPKMGNLPKPRISQLKPFSESGVDFGGPFLVVTQRSRGCKAIKCYICLFVCMATKALHLELATDLSSDVFLAAFRRFVSRRGRCSHLYCDRGTNFVGANTLLKSITHSMSHLDGVEFHFLPGNSPHMGGLWEAGIKSVKTHLKRVIGDQILSYEELNTVLVEVEAVLNSRPLTAISTDPNDLSVLTPGHFLTLEPLVGVPDPDLTDLKISRLSRWQLIQRIHQDFWKKWHVEYLHTLQQRSKWLTSSNLPKEGALVLIKNDNLPLLKWKLGRISALHPGADGVARVATIKTKDGLLKRSLVKLCPLPEN